MSLIVGLFIAQDASAAGLVGGRPANPDPTVPLTQSMFVYSLKPDENKQDQIFISNGSDETQTINVYPADGYLTNIGSFTCQTNDKKNKDVGTWIALEKNQVTLAAKGDITLGFTVKVPGDVSASEHNGCIVIQNTNPNSSAQFVRMVVNTTTDLSRSVEISSFTRSKGENGFIFKTDIKNDGNVSADANLEIVTKDVFGHETYRSESQYPVMGGAKLQLSQPDGLRSFWGGFFTSQATVSFDKRAGVYGTYDRTQLGSETSPKISYYVPPSSGAYLVLVVIVVLVAGVFVWTRQQKSLAKTEAKTALGSAKNSWVSYTIKSGDTLESIAGSIKSSADKISVMNKLRPDKELKIGQVIYVPKRNRG